MESELNNQKLDDICRQVEFYFSDINLRHDSIMSELTGAKNKSSFLRGTTWVLAEKLMDFNRMKELTSTRGIEDIFDALESVKASEPKLLEVDRDEKRMRRFKPVPLNELEKDLTPCTIYLENFDLDSTSQDILREKFSQFGQVAYISLPHFPQGHPINIDRQERPLSQGYAFIEFTTPDEASIACGYYNNLNYSTNHFSPRVMMKSTWLEYQDRYFKLQKLGYKEAKLSILISRPSDDSKKAPACEQPSE